MNNGKRTQWRASAVVKEVARENRKKPTEAEKALWAMLRDGRCDEYKFRRQTPIGPFVADFTCPQVKLIVEADGGIHDDETQARRDAERDEILRDVNGTGFSESPTTSFSIIPTKPYSG